MCQTGMASGNLADRHSTVPLTGTHTRPRSAPCQPCKGIVAVHHGHHHTQRPRPPPNRVPPCAPDPSTRCHRVCASRRTTDTSRSAPVSDTLPWTARSRRTRVREEGCGKGGLAQVTRAFDITGGVGPIRRAVTAHGTHVPC